MAKTSCAMPPIRACRSGALFYRARALSARAGVTAYLAAALLASAVLAMPVAAARERPPFIVPGDPRTEIGRLPAGYARLVPVAGQAAVAPRVPEIGQAQRLLQVAARTGDGRLASRAGQILSRLPESDPRPAVLAARAFAAQHRHDFAGALRWLDRWIEVEPRSGDARLARAQVHLVGGRLDLARKDCAALALGIDVRDGILCAAGLALRRGEYAQAASLADRWLARASPKDGDLGYVRILRAEAAARGGDPRAHALFRRALARDPDDVRTLAAYARYLRASGRNREVLQLLSGSAAHEGLRLQYALAAHAVAAPQAAALADAMARRHALAHAAGAAPELRDEAEFLLTLRSDPEGALRLASRNFASQRDVEDVDILVRAATAANRPDALRPLREWAAAHGLPPPDMARRAQ